MDKKRDDDRVDLTSIFRPSGFDDTRHIYFEQSSTLRSAYLSVVNFKDMDTTFSLRHISLVNLTKSSATTKIRKELEQLGWQVSEHFSPFEKVETKSTVLVLDDLFSPVLPSISEDQWESLKTLISIGSRILWVTEGSQMDVSDPTQARQ